MITASSEHSSQPIPNSVWVEIQFPDLDYKRDALLPTQMPISELKAGLLTLLKNRESRRFSKIESISILYNGKVLPDDATFASKGIWDGSVLVLAKSRKASFAYFK